jgi:hypothetical protein
MRAKATMLLAAAAVFLLGPGAGAAEKPGKPLDIKPAAAKQSDPGWRARAMKARAEFAPDGSPPVSGNARALDERGDRRDGEEAGSGRLREDRGEGGE